MRFLLLVALATLVLPSPALAGWGDENWGTLIWGKASAVPTISWLGLGVLALGLAATAAWTLRKRRPGLALPVLLVLLAVVAGTATGVPNTFENGTVADADEVNANFSSLEARIAVIEAALGISGRFDACSDGVTVADTATGLLWERKTTTGDVHDVDNLYTWSSSCCTAADGTAYTVFLATLNTAAFAGYTDWRLPIISELQSILVGPGVTTVAAADPADPASGTNPTGQASTCGSAPCIDPAFAAVGGPTVSSLYWSASSNATNPNFAWYAFFADGFVHNFNHKTFEAFVRAVRTGSCSS